MTFIRGSVGILAWAVLVCAGLAVVVWVMNGEIGSAVIAGFVAWGAWAALKRLVESDEFTAPS